MSDQLDQVVRFLNQLQDEICQQLAAEDGKADFLIDDWTRAEGGGGSSRVLENGACIERGGVNFSKVHGSALPAAASKRHPELAGREFVATGVSLVIHPHNPHVPTTHMNVRYFQAGDIWWFGGGYDLTPYYPVHEDVLHWHRTAQAACDSIDTALYAPFKKHCDEYFYLPHREETRGVGGIFYDDFRGNSFEQAFALMCAVGESFLPAYMPILQARKDQEYGQQERDFQLYRRGRYVEFNLIHDRGTLFGLQSGGRTESILMSMPPQANWRYDWQPEAGSAEERLYKEYLRPQNWLSI